MKKLTSDELRELFLEFFKSKGHAVIKSASLIPENDPTVLFTTAGMHPLVPYLLGEKHPAGTRLADVQKCVRTGDIDEVGDASHCTFFEMLGNWSLGDYFKKEAIAYSFEFLTDEKWLGIEKDKLYFTCFEGDADAPRDTESHDIWVSLGVKEDHIFYLPKKHNWWGPAGQTGPCGPDTEMFIDTGKPACGEDCNPSCDCGKYLEIWNDVFMQYNKQADGSFAPLEQKNVDTGMGLDRTICILQGKNSVYETDVFAPVLSKLQDMSGKTYNGADDETVRAFRIVADHIRCATFMIGDEKGITPSNVDQGYVLRRLLRRAIRFAGKLGIQEGMLSKIAQVVIEQYRHAYPELEDNKQRILSEIDKEEGRFQKTITQGLKEFEKVAEKLQGDTIDGKSAFRLYDTFGFPLEFTLELAKERGLKVDTDGFDAAFKHHQELSQAGAEQRFAGGLADTGEQTARLHTATHLLLAGLKKVLSDDINQKGSNITAERLRFDFNFPRKVEREELDQVEAYVNEAIAAGLDVEMQEMSAEEAKAQGATGVFDAKYGDVVKVYTVPGYSKEICGGPHAKNTAELGKFKIKKEQSSSSGVRRIKAVLTDQ
ncbi:MAG: alanine--tRNA ligase [Christensenellaceae bacterium]|jgi:alanyl-tRNA synthetase